MDTPRNATIRLHEEDNGRIRIEVETLDTCQIVYTRSTKWDANIIGRVERYLRDANVLRATGYNPADGYMYAAAVYVGAVTA